MAVHRTRNKAITLRLTDDEYKFFRSEFEKSRMGSQSDFVLKQIKGNPIVVKEGLIETLAELRRQGNNLNQLLRATYYHDMSELVKETVLQVLMECREAYRVLVKEK